MSDVMARWGLTPVINASGTMTTLGASRVSPAVRALVDDILGRFVRMDELQAAASRVIAQATGAEAGYVTSSSSAAMTLACAAAITSDNPAAILALPDTPTPARIAVQAGHLINYGAPVAQAVRASGAQVVPLGTAALCEAFDLENATRNGLTAIVHVVSHHTVREGELPLPLVAEIAQAHGIPVILDMASEYGLTTPARLGITAAIWSGHKFLGGPTSGIVAGQGAFIRAMLLQNRGLGRLMKAGKEAVAGAMAALEQWSARDHAAARAAEEAITALWLSRLSGLPGLSLALHGDWTCNPITRVEILMTPDAPLHAWELADRCMAGNPAVALRDDLVERQLLYLDPCNLTLAEAAVVSDRITQVVSEARQSASGRAQSWVDVKRARGRW